MGRSLNPVVRYAEWREAVDPEHPLARYDAALRVAAAASGLAFGWMCCCLVGSVPASILASRTAKRSLARRRLERLRDVPAVQEQHPCLLALKKDVHVYGRDEGLVSFVEGALLYEGRRTSFSVPKDSLRSGQAFRSGFGFTFPTPAGHCEVVLEPIDLKAFRSDFDRWYYKVESVNDWGVFPPFRPQAAFRHWAKLARGAVVFAGFAGAAATWETYLAVGLTPALCLAILVLLAVVVLYGYARSYGRTLDGLDHLRRPGEGEDPNLSRARVDQRGGAGAGGVARREYVVHQENAPPLDETAVGDEGAQ